MMICRCLPFGESVCRDVFYIYHVPNSFTKIHKELAFLWIFSVGRLEAARLDNLAIGIRRIQIRRANRLVQCLWFEHCHWTMRLKMHSRGVVR